MKLLEALLVAAITALAASVSVLVMTECASLATGDTDEPVQVMQLIVVLSFSGNYCSCSVEMVNTIQ